jgi:cob(I)alamin adenosyltransferase
MGNRLSKIYTRTGDDGSTGLSDGTRVAKDDARIEAIGAVDELNSSIGVLLCESLPAEIHDCLTAVQNRLFDIGGELSLPGHSLLADDQVTGLEHILERLNNGLPALREFILPGGTRAAAMCHLARTLCRRAERRVYTLGKASPVNSASARYLNRLSDLLFVMARYLNRQAGKPDIFWQHERNQV